ncbi:hypothetical protein TNCV_1592741 [Trichonephila clavipes]|nr:hypothetical protein TNCV_1592741 [Trichonephila clavipes]
MYQYSLQTRDQSPKRAKCSRSTTQLDEEKAHWLCAGASVKEYVPSLGSSSQIESRPSHRSGRRKGGKKPVSPFPSRI